MLDSDSDGYVDCIEVDKDEVEIAKKALYIDFRQVGNYNVSQEPSNGTQYLLQVREELKTIPGVVVVPRSEKMLNNPKKSADIYFKYKDISNEVLSYSIMEECCDPRFLPKKLSRESSIAQFLTVQNVIENTRKMIEDGKISIPRKNIPGARNCELWRKFCFGPRVTNFLENSQLEVNPQYICHKDYLEDFFGNMCTNDEVLINGLTEEKMGDDSVVENKKTSIDVTQQKCIEEFEQLSILDLPANAKVSFENSIDGSGIKLKDEEVQEMDTIPSEGCEPVKGCSLNDNGPEDKKRRNENLGNLPTPTIMYNMSSAQVESLITYHTDWLRNYGLFNHIQCKWIYSLLSFVHRPLNPKTESDIREICKYFIIFKNSFLKFKEVGSSKAMSEKEKSNLMASDLFMSFISNLNVIIYLIADYFEEKDLIDHNFTTAF